jgi:hypothetical protein
MSSLWQTRFPSQDMEFDGFPDTKGDWLWVEMWGCGCCVHKCGVAWVHDEVDLNDPPPIHYALTNTVLGISWEGNKPTFEDKEEKNPIITAWMKITLPKMEE